MIFLKWHLRCSFNGSIKLGNYSLIIPNFTNRTFACELYLKTTLYLTKNDLSREHKLDELFLKLDEKDQKQIYDIWQTIEGQDIEDCDYAKDMLDDNLVINSDAFCRFRYVHKWVGATISLESSFTEKQMHLHSLSYSNSKLFKGFSVYDGFLDQFAKSIKQYNNQLVKLK